MEDAAPAPCREVDIVVYLQERGAGACPDPVGYRVTLDVCPGDGLSAVTLRPMREPTLHHVIHRHSAIWRVCEAFLMVLPALRHKAAMPHVKEVA